MGDWFAIYVQPRHEKSVAFTLKAKEIQACLPMIHSRRAWRDRTKWLDMPAFPGYVFGRLDPGQRTPVLSTPGVVRIVGFGKVPVAIPQEEIDSLLTLERVCSTAEPWPYLRDGERVCIKGGPLDGLTGILCEERKQARVTVSVTLLQRSVAVEVDRSQLVPLRASPIPLSRFQAGA